MEKSAPFADEAGPSAPEIAITPHMCRCGRAPWRPGQRNCLFCNREANKRYRESLKREEARLAAQAMVPK